MNNNLIDKVKEEGVRHYLNYDMHSCKVSWCETCKAHFYNERNREHTTIATQEHYHTLPAKPPPPEQPALPEGIELMYTMSQMEAAFIAGVKIKWKGILIKYVEIKNQFNDFIKSINNGK